MIPIKDIVYWACGVLVVVAILSFMLGWSMGDRFDLPEELPTVTFDVEWPAT